MNRKTRMTSLRTAVCACVEGGGASVLNTTCTCICSESVQNCFLKRSSSPDLIGLFQNLISYNFSLEGPFSTIRTLFCS